MRKTTSFQEMKTDHLKCRSLLHAWDPQRTLVETYDRKKVYRVELECLRCGTVRTDIIHASTGDKLAMWYTYPDKYNIDDPVNWGGRKVFNSNVRLELYGRLAKNGRR